MNLDRIWTLQLKKKDGSTFWFFVLTIEWSKYFKFNFSLKVLITTIFLYNKISTSQENYRYFQLSFYGRKKIHAFKISNLQKYTYFM